MALLNFDATTIAPQENLTPIPAGTYVARIIESDVRPLKSGNGDGLLLTFEIIDGPYARRRVWANINVRHISEEAQRIGQQQLSSLCHAVGVLKLQDSVQLHDRPLKIRVAVRKDDKYEERNEIKGYEALQSSAAAPAPAAAQPQQTRPTPPWVKA